nr:MAG: hypothetical protein DIU62_03080 [Pseudomonadota bacterium]
MKSSHRDYLDRNHLAIVRAVDRFGTLTAAAQALHLTQSALSHAIGRLERAVGTPLWRREGRSFIKFTEPLK